MSLATIRDFIRFIVHTSRGFLEEAQKRVTVDSMITFAEWFFAGFDRVTGKDRSEVYNVSACQGAIECPKLNRAPSVD